VGRALAPTLAEKHASSSASCGTDWPLVLSNGIASRRNTTNTAAMA